MQECQARRALSLEIRCEAIHFPIAVTSWIEPAATADLLSSIAHVTIAVGASRRRLSKRAFSRRTEGTPLGRSGLVRGWRRRIGLRLFDWHRL